MLQPEPKDEKEHDLSESGSDSGSDHKQKKKATKPKGKANGAGDGLKKRGAKRAAESDGAPSKKVKAELVKPDLKELNFDCDRTTSVGKKWNLKISSWNVAGLRAWVKVFLTLFYFVSRT